MSFEEFFPSILRESDDFSVFVKLADKELSTIKDTIQLLETLTNVDRTPSEFVKSIGEIIGFTYVDTYDENVQRECIKSVWEAKKEIGTHHALVMAATYGDIDGYIGGDLFIPGTFTYYNSEGEELPPEEVAPEDKPGLPEPEAPINPDVPEIPDDKDILFTWSHSSWSGGSIYPGPNTNKSTINPNISTFSLGRAEMVLDKKPVEAVVILPREYLFKWSHSSRSGNHKFAGPTIYKEGTILIELTRLNEKIQRRVESVKPAGMQVVYKYIHDGQEEIVTYLK